MIEAVKKILQLKKKEFIEMAVVLAVIIVLAGILEYILFTMGIKADGIVPIVTIVTFSFFVFAQVIVAFTSLSQMFNLSVGMGMTRKQFYPAYYISELLLSLMVIIVCAITWIIERSIYVGRFGKKFKGIEFLDLNQVFGKWQNVLLFICVILLIFAVSMLVGSFMLRFGNKAAVTVWIALALVYAAIGRITNATVNNEQNVLGDIGRTFAGIPKHNVIWMALPIVFIAFILVYALGYRMLKKQAVTQ